MKNLLKISIPMTHTFSHNNSLLAILNAYEETNGWVYSNFINIFFTLKGVTGDFLHNYYGDWQFLEHKMCPWLKYQRINKKSIIKYWENIIEFCCEQIDDNNYIYLSVDKFYIANYKEDSHWYHPLFIYGYDREEQVFFAADHFFGGKYDFQRINMKELTQAFISEFDGEEHLEGIELLEFRKSSACNHIKGIEEIFEINIPKIVLGIEEYLLKRPIFINSKNYYVGIDYYDVLIKYIRLMKNKNIDIRMFSTLYDHKVMMTKRVEYLIKNKYIKDDSCELLDKFIAIKNICCIIESLVLKYNYTHDERITHRICCDIDDIRDLEMTLLEELLYRLQACYTNSKHSNVYDHEDAQETY